MTLSEGSMDCEGIIHLGNVAGGAVRSLGTAFLGVYYHVAGKSFRKQGAFRKVFMREAEVHGAT